MRVMTLGEVKNLPSSESVLAALRGEPGGWGKVLLSTLLRSLLIAPGVFLAGGRGWKLAAGSLVASSSITTFLLIWHYAHGVNGQASGQPAPLPAPGPQQSLPAPEQRPDVVSLEGYRRRRVR